MSRLGFLKVVSGFFGAEQCLTKIKVEEPVKVIAFDEKNARLTVMTHERILYFFDIPEQQTRYVDSAQVRIY